jgi:hypothetical protein
MLTLRLLKPSERIQLIEHFLLRSAGVQPSLIQERCPEQKTKYLTLGTLLLSIPVLSSFAAGYAVYSVFLSPGLAIFLGCFWGFIVYNLDRTILQGFHKRQQQSRWQALKMIAPRLFLAVALAIPMAYPLEKRLFYDGIKKMSLEQQSVQNIQPDIERLKRENDQLFETWQHLNKQKDEYVASVYQQKRENISLIGQQMQEKQDEIEANKARILALEQQLSHEQTRHLGFTEQIVYFQQLTDTYPEAETAGWFITFLFIGIEVTVVLVKALMPYGIYDAIIEEMEESRIQKSLNDLEFAKLKMRLELKQESQILQEVFKTASPALENITTEIILDIINGIQTHPEFQEIQQKFYMQALERVADYGSGVFNPAIHQPDSTQDISRYDTQNAAFRYVQYKADQKKWDWLSKNATPGFSKPPSKRKKNTGKKRRVDPPHLQDS